ncbi:D-mannonate dehydratase [Marinoscillum furvescens DSM 4134]|uniref:Mannonate dehydratase n=2 Tax=Marinoscillum furvescens TaxID=1026 RepID=A0A3D9L4Y2_MARFU|nr:D-mannonate dehydratase [Marinoscillum furvescens DSM 4134]
MRWYGPNDPVSLEHIRQAGCVGVVTALHHIPVGDVWTPEEIELRKALVEGAGMTWKVVESLPVHEDIKKQTGNFTTYITNYQESLRNLAAAGLEVITYNFMPVLDWVRTAPYHRRADGSTTLRFERDAFAAADIFLLKRPNAEKDYSEQEISAAENYLNNLTIDEQDSLLSNILLGLPGSEDAFTPEQVLAALKTYDNIDRNQLKQHLFAFLEAVVPVAEACNLKLAIHPDDPPFPVLGLPRIVSTAEDAADIINCVPSPANGLCFCTGSFGARPDNDLIGMMKQFEEHIHFLHLRNTKSDAYGNFEEAPHLEGDADMAGIVMQALRIMQKQQRSIPMRPDHGHQMLDDLQKKTYPGYSAIGRLKSLAELRGLEMGILEMMQ